MPSQPDSKRERFRPRRTSTALVLSALAAILLPACGSDSNGNQTPTPDATTAATPKRTPKPTPEATPPPPPQLTLVGQHDLDGYGGADVWANGDVAYVGGRCFAGGAKIVDVSDPQDPQLVGTAADHAYTAADDLMVIDARTPFFEGELMAVGLQSCPNEDGEQGLQGLDLWNVTDPAQPERLGFIDVGPLPSGGVHEMYLFQRQDRVFALLAVPFSEVFHPAGLGDLRIVEVTDPRNPVQLADWGAGKDLGLPFGAASYESQLHGAHAPGEFEPRSRCTAPPGEGPLCRGGIPWVIAHSASANDDGTRAYVSYWDAGMIILDITDPARPVLLGRAQEPAVEEGNVHSAISVPGDDLAITTDEDFVHPPRDGAGLPDGTPLPGDRWGYARIWDISDPAQPRQIGIFETPNSAGNDTEGLFTVHNPEVHSDLLYLSWYSDGLRVLDISDPASPREVASFVPPSQRIEGETVPALIWGVHVEGDLVFLSDMSAGLYILKIAR